MSLKYRYTCPFDSKHTIPRPLGDLALHMGLKTDRLHEDWRKRHGLPNQMDFQSVNKKRFEIMKAIIEDKDIFQSIEKIFKTNL